MIAVRAAGAGFHSGSARQRELYVKHGSPMHRARYTERRLQFKRADVAAITARSGVGDGRIIHRSREAALIEVTGERRNGIALPVVDSRAVDARRMR